MTAYPPEPWNLSGRGWITLWRVDTDATPPLPRGVRPLRLGQRALAVTAFVDYASSGLLAYRELLAGIPVRDGLRTGLCITEIWVDSPESRAGGRELWGIPKELATFPDPTTAYEPARDSAADDSAGGAGALIASARFAAGGRSIRLPFPLRSRTIQRTASDAPWHSRLIARGRVARTTAQWDLRADGPLGWLADARPLLSLDAPEFAMTFGPSLAP